jgi:hypothetical protein
MSSGRTAFTLLVADLSSSRTFGCVSFRCVLSVILVAFLLLILLPKAFIPITQPVKKTVSFRLIIKKILLIIN